MRICTSLFLFVLVAPAVLAADERVLYVSPAGSDRWNGSSATPTLGAKDDGPLATLEAARQAIRKLHREQADTKTGRPIIVKIVAGDYYFDRSFELTAEDSGTAQSPIVYAAAGDGEVRLIGGKWLAADAFQPVTNQTLLDILPAEARKEVRCVELSVLGITDLGTYPDSFRSLPVIPELYFNNRRMTLARWPNEGWANIAKVIESGPAEWRKHKSDSLGVFEYSGDRPTRWLRAPAVWLLGYWCFDWAEETIRVKNIDAGKRQITLGSRHFYGLGKGNLAPRRYCAVNLLEELDSPGEYFIDRKEGRLYFWAPAALQGARVVLSTLKSPILATKDASHVTFRGLTFESCVGNAIEVAGGRGVCIEACRVHNTGLSGIMVNEGLHHSVRDCEIYDTGCMGVSIKGGDRKTLAPSSHEVVNNHIYRPSRRQLTSAGHIHLGGVGVRVAHNLLNDSPHTAIMLAGNDHIIEYNEVHHVATESDDVGAFYMGRNPSERGNIIRYNYWHDIGSNFAHGSSAIYCDDGTGGQTVFGNVFCRAACGNFGAVFVHGGHDNTVANNVFIDCKRAVGHTPWPDKMWKEWVDGELWHQRLLEEVDITRPPYSDRYPDLRGFMQPEGRMRVNYATRNVAFRCGEFGKGDWEQLGNYVTVTDPGFVNMADGNFQLRDDSPVFRKMPGFGRIPFSEMGLKHSASRPSASTP